VSFPTPNENLMAFRNVGRGGRRLINGARLAELSPPTPELALVPLPAGYVRTRELSKELQAYLVLREQIETPASPLDTGTP
jgi:hypothetical protein